eukprot:ANDGO_01615.mRNA.1 Hsp70-Hsp90 organizing protein 1
MAVSSKKIRFNSLVSEADSCFRKREFERACQFYTEALDIDATDKTVLLQRCRCYISLGVPERGVMDAESTLKLDKTFWRGVLAKAQALYAGGNFEFALIQYYRGARMRPDIDDFRLGVQKCKAAINESVDQEELDSWMRERGSTTVTPFEDFELEALPRAFSAPASHMRAVSADASPRRPLQPGATIKPTSPAPASASASANPNSSTRAIPRLDLSDLQTAPSGRTVVSATSSQFIQEEEELNPSNRRSRSARRPRSSKELLGALNADLQFLAELKEDTILRKSVGRTQGPSAVSSLVDDGVAFMEKRREFWKQQMPPQDPSRKTANGALSTRRSASTARSYGSRSVSLTTSRSTSSKVLAPSSARGPVTALDAVDHASDSEEEIVARPQPPVSARSQASSRSKQSANGRSVSSGRGDTTNSVVSKDKQQSQFAQQQQQQQQNVKLAVPQQKQRHLQQTKYAIEMLEKINQSIESGELENALKYSKAFLSKLATLDLSDKPRILGNVYSLMGTTYLELDKLTLAAIHHRKDLDIAMRYSYTDSYMRSLENLGITYERMGDYAQAIRMWEKKLDSSTEDEQSRLWEDIGRCYYQLNDCETAISFAQKALDAATQSNDRERMLSVQYTIGHTFCKIRQFSKALPYFEGYLGLAKQLGDVVAEANALTDLGNAYLELGDVPKSISYQQQAMSLSSKLQ